MMPDGLDRIKNARILVVEDSIANQTLAREMLVHAGAQVDMAENGREAIKAIKNAVEPYNAVLMDLRMPIMDGLEAIGIIRGELAQHKLPIIATTANTEEQEQKRCLDAGANDCLNKPYRIHDLYAVLIRWVEPSGKDSDALGEGEQANSDDASRAAEALLPADIAGIDVADGLSRLGQNRALYIELLAEFADTNAGVGQEVAAAAAAGDLDRVSFLVHTIRSTAGNIGADGLSRAAADTESKIEKGGPAVAAPLARFQGELAQVVGAIRAAGITVPHDQIRRPFDCSAFDRDEAGRLIKTLLNLLGDQNLDAGREFDELAAMLGGRGHDAILSELAENVEALKYSDARRILARAKKDLLI